MHRDFPALQIRRPLNAIEVHLTDSFDPHGLPNAGGARVPDRVRLQPPVLFASGLLQVVRIVFDPYRNPLLSARLQRVRDIRIEGSVASLMLHDGDVVYPDAGVVVHRAEMQ